MCKIFLCVVQRAKLKQTATFVWISPVPAFHWKYFFLSNYNNKMTQIRSQLWRLCFVHVPFSSIFDSNINIIKIHSASKIKCALLLYIIIIHATSKYAHCTLYAAWNAAWKEHICIIVYVFYITTWSPEHTRTHTLLYVQQRNRCVLVLNRIACSIQSEYRINWRIHTKIRTMTFCSFCQMFSFFFLFLL